MPRLTTRIALAVSTALMLTAAPAAAQRIERIVAFGDSYADDGNLFELLGIPRPAIYPNGRFSNGTNFIDTMSELLNVPVSNFAIGGAFTGNGNINGQAGPIGGVQYARVKMDGFNESGDQVLTLSVSDRRASELAGFAGLEAQFETEVGELSAKPFVKLAAEKELDSSGGEIRYASSAAPAIVNRFTPEQGPDNVYGRVEGGASLALGSALALEVQASATVEHPQRDEFTGFFGLKVGF